MKNILILILLSNLFQHRCFGQNGTMDSLKIELRNAKEDTTRLNLFIALCNACNIEDNLKYGDAAVKLADKLILQSKNNKEKMSFLKLKAKAFRYFVVFYQDKKDTNGCFKYEYKRLSIFKEINDTANIINSITKISYFYHSVGNIPKEIESIQKGIELSAKMGYKNGLAVCTAQLAQLYDRQGYYKLALEKYKECLSISTALKDTSFMVYYLIKIGDVNSSLHNFENTLENLYKAIKISEISKDSNTIVQCYFQIGRTYKAKSDFPKALEYLNKSLRLSIEGGVNIKWSESSTLRLIGNVYFEQNIISEAISYHQRALKGSEKSNNIFETGWACLALAKDYLQQKKYNFAKNYSDISVNMANKTGDLPSIIDAEKISATVDSSAGNYKDAYRHFQKYIMLRDELNSEEVQAMATKEKFQSEFDKQKVIDKKEQEKKDAITKKEKEKEKVIRTSYAMGLALTLLLAGVSYRNFRIKKKDNVIITTQKELVEEQNKEIKDSILYALRIQTAILPPHRIIKQYLEESFILYKPKDIVAGDFYWMETVNDLVLFAACDCTGHGVPGALVSVVCHNALNRAVREFGLTQPAEILDKTAEIVIENFSKSEEDIKDGMDISLCSFNAKTKTIQWAGANNPLWLVRKGELIETKADKQPIGRNDNTRPFTNHQFNLNADDSIYLFTDGFADQFGGVTGEKKLTRKRFKEQLLFIQDKSMQEQGIILDKFIVEYRKNVEQIDDILVMGVKV
jgi:serine phosphatase RsbU (regulator of sigma subunit)